MVQIQQTMPDQIDANTGKIFNITNPYDQVAMVNQSMQKFYTSINENYTKTMAIYQKSQVASGALHEAIDGAGTDKNTVFEILENLTPEERAATEREYATKFGNGDLSKLRKDLRDDLSGDDEKRAFKALNSGINKVDVAVSANALKEAMEGSGTDKNTVHQIMDVASASDLRSIENLFDKSENNSGALRNSIRDDFSGQEQDDLISKLNQAAVKE